MPSSTSTPQSGKTTPALSGAATPASPLLDAPASPSSPAADNEDDGALTCHICANPITYLSLSPCLHATCHICALRLRALYKSTNCTVCKQAQPRLLFLLPSTLPDPGALEAPTTEDREKVFDEFLSRCPFSDEALAIAFETLGIKQATLQLLRFNCPFSSLHTLTDPDSPPPKGAPREPCTFVAVRGGFPELARHTRERHGRMLCDLCVRSKKIFAHEHVLYTPGQLVEHLPSLKKPGWDVPRIGERGRGRGRGRAGRGGHGRGPPGREGEAEEGEAEGGIDAEEDDTVEWSHPLCAFCRECFASSDELYAHLREAHEECFICRRAGERDVYFQNYPSLERHFQTAHYPCTHASCLAQHFVVFPTAMDLKAHIVESHAGDLTTRELREMRELDVQGLGMFVDSPVPGAPAGGSGGGRAGRRGRFGAQLTTSTGSTADAGSGGGAAAGPADESDQARSALSRQPLSDTQASAWQALLTLLPVLPPTQLLALRSSLLAWLSHQSTARDLLTILVTVLSHPSASPAVSRAGGEPDELVLRALQNLANRGQLGEDEEQELRTTISSFKAGRAAAFPSLARSGEYGAIASGRGIAAPTPGPAVRAGPASAGGQGGRAGGAGAGGQRTVWDRVERAAQRTVPGVPGASYTTPAQHAAQPVVARQPQAAGQAFPALSASAAAGVRRTAAPAPTAWSSSSTSSRPQPAPAPPATPLPSRPTSSTHNAVIRSTPGSGSSTPRRPPAPPDTRAFPGLPTREVPKVPLGAVGGNRSLRNILGHSEASGGSGSSWGRSAGGGGGGGGGASGLTEGVNGNGNGNGSGSTAVQSGGGGAAGAAGGAGAGGGKKKKKGKETLFTLGSFPT